jgi:hypothetical protein
VLQFEGFGAFQLRDDLTGFVDGDITDTRSGSVDLDGVLTLTQSVNAGQVLTIGFPYMALAETLPLDTQTHVGRRRFAKVVLRLAPGSSVPSVNGEVPLPSDAMGNYRDIEGEDFVSPDYEANSLGWGRGVLTLQQTEAEPAEILAIFGVTGDNEV